MERIIDDVEAQYSFRVCFSNPGDCKKIHQTWGVKYIQSIPELRLVYISTMNYFFLREEEFPVFRMLLYCIWSVCIMYNAGKVTS